MLRYQLGLRVIIISFLNFLQLVENYINILTRLLSTLRYLNVDNAY